MDTAMVPRIRIIVHMHTDHYRRECQWHRYHLVCHMVWTHRLASRKVCGVNINFFYVLRFYIFLILVKSWFWLQFAQFHSGKPVLYLKYVITSVLATHLMNKPLCLCASPKDWLFDRKMKWIRTENGVNKTIKCKLKSENFNTFVNRVIRIGQWLMSFSINVLFLFILSISFDSYSFDMVALIPMSVRRRSVALNIQ